MKSKALVQRTLARDDIDQAIAHYLEQDAAAAAQGFVDALERAYSDSHSFNQLYLRDLCLPQKTTNPSVSRRV